ncbi:heavy metal cation transport atpase [Dorcoceras hygrometricum]|uniref:Heavy metal cation transport atpase n=1 Tax=Dorcoceras hygrometricum TaxID=472368 RepID=A0A2Z7APA0_9LAMI|nr:heavy metal cation transport atpase [Dorcoceras hygrometricum]
MRRGAKFGLSCDDISLDVITISRWISADEAKRKKPMRRRIGYQQMKQSARSEATSYGDSADGLLVMTSSVTSSSRKKIQAKLLMIQSQATAASSPTEACKVKDASTFTLQRSVAPKWKEDKIAFWSAEEFWKLSNGKNFSEAIYLWQRPLKKCPAHRERDAVRSFSWCYYITVGNIH